jgi:hypothetical protein
MGIDGDKARVSADVGVLQGHCWLPVTLYECHMTVKLRELSREGEEMGVLKGKYQEQGHERDCPTRTAVRTFGDNIKMRYHDN